MKKFIFFIIGPTCVGKTDLSILLVQKYPFEIISMDSTMIYKYMDIGTAKPNKKILSKFKHNLIDICDPFDKYSGFDFYFDSLYLIESCFVKNKFPLFVGGSMMYFNLLNYNLISLKRDINFLIFIILPFDENKYVLSIKNRLNDMIKNGLIDEVKFLYNRHNSINSDCNSIKSIGYNEVWLYLDGKLKFKYVLDLIFISTINLYYKQLLWLKKIKKNVIFLENDLNKSFIYLDKFINNNLKIFFY